MSPRFEAATLKQPELFDEVSRLSPRSPFNTRFYAEASRAIGLQPFGLLVSGDKSITDGCVALLTTGSWRRRLEIPSVPRLADAATFWKAVEKFCCDQKVIDLEINSFASEDVCLPSFAHRLKFRDRCEYVLDLDGDLDSRLGSNHRRNIKKARKAELRTIRTRSAEAGQQHFALMHKSANRRTARGEHVDMPDDVTFHTALLQYDSGELFQACDGDEVISSILVIGGSEAAYYHSAGTSPAGMKSGASQFLISEVAKLLQQDGLCQLNLGGADSDGLRAFKLGFGATERPLQAASYSMVSPLARRARKLAYLVRRVPSKVMQLVR